LCSWPQSLAVHRGRGGSRYSLRCGPGGEPSRRKPVRSDEESKKFRRKRGRASRLVLTWTSPLPHLAKGGKPLAFPRAEQMPSSSNSIRQAAVIAVRAGRVCLVQSSGGKRWVIPKGHIARGHTAAETALCEAWEEAGLLGHLRPEPVGSY